MRIYKIKIEGYFRKKWHGNWSSVSVHAENFDEAIKKPKLKKNERIEEVELIAESDF